MSDVVGVSLAGDLQLLPPSEPAEPTGVSVHAGFPNPAADIVGRSRALALDLNQLLIHHPSSTYAFRISGEQWAEQGIFDGDIALIDRALSPKTKQLVVRWDVGSFVLKRYQALARQPTPWGVVTAIIHPY